MSPPELSQSGTDPRVPHQRWSVPVFIRFVKYCTISHYRITSEVASPCFHLIREILHYFTLQNHNPSPRLTIPRHCGSRGARALPTMWNGMAVAFRFVLPNVATIPICFALCGCGMSRQKQEMTPWTTDARMVGCSRCSDDSSQKGLFTRKLIVPVISSFWA